MKITKTADRVSQFKLFKDIANQGCHICPTCKTPVDIGIGMCKRWATGLFTIRHMQIDCYSCRVCGTQWESEPYQKG